MYKCCECGKEFKTPGTYQECVGDFWGSPAYETFDRCPYCKSDFIEDLDEEAEYERWEKERY